MPKNVWYLAWPDGIEPIEWEVYMALHRVDASMFHGSRGPFPDADMAEDWRFHDRTEGYFDHGIAVYAQHCSGCGRFAKVLAFDDAGEGWAWRVTECAKCGIRDSRELKG